MQTYAPEIGDPGRVSGDIVQEGSRPAAVQEALNCGNAA
jgi:hypothetical protein